MSRPTPAQTASMSETEKLSGSDSAAGSRIRTLLQRRYEGLGQSPRGARRGAGLRLLASLGLATLFAPWLVLATALCSRVLVSHGAYSGERDR